MTYLQKLRVSLFWLLLAIIVFPFYPWLLVGIIKEGLVRFLFGEEVHYG